jgi:hypothetical protein
MRRRLYCFSALGVAGLRNNYRHQGQLTVDRSAATSRIDDGQVFHAAGRAAVCEASDAPVPFRARSRATVRLRSITLNGRHFSVDSVDVPQVRSARSSRGSRRLSVTAGHVARSDAPGVFRFAVSCSTRPAVPACDFAGDPSVAEMVQALAEDWQAARYGETTRGKALRALRHRRRRHVERCWQMTNWPNRFHSVEPSCIFPERRRSGSEHRQRGRRPGSP